MKIKEIEKTYKENIYVAVDGKEFTNETDCKEWENSYKCTIKQSFDKLPKINISKTPIAASFYCCEDEKCYVVEPSCLDDIALINAYAQNCFSHPALLDITYIGKKVVINFGYDDYFSFTLLDDLIKNFNSNIESINNAFVKSEPTEKAE